MADFQHDERVIIYPAYLNKNKSVKEGRRITKDQACNNPLTPEIYDCATKGLNLKAEPEGKTYPRDWMYRGRVRVQLKNKDGNPVNPSIPTKKELMVRIAELIERHPNRTGKGKAAGDGSSQQVSAAQVAAASAAAASRGGGGASSSSGGGGTSGSQPSKKSGGKKKK